MCVIMRITEKLRWCKRGAGYSRAVGRGILVIFLGLLGLCVADVHAAPTAIPHGTLELIAENQWIAAGRTVHLGLRFQLEKGWHIYWVNPGDSGEPPRVTWQLPKGLTAGEMEWPTPRRLGTASIVDFGYEDAVTLLVPVHAAAGLEAQGTAQLGAEVKVLVCREMCIPGKAQLLLTLPVKSELPAADDHTKDLFTAARKSLPRSVPRNWRLSAVEANGSFVLTVNVGQQITQAIFFPLAESQIDDAAPQNFVSKSGGFRLTLRKSDQLLKPLERLKGLLVLSAEQAYLIDVPLGKPGAARNGGGGDFHLASFLWPSGLKGLQGLKA
jgi:DsbC/DsbD-like thiol-disulfide interchange protein